MKRLLPIAMMLAAVVTACGGGESSQNALRSQEPLALEDYQHVVAECSTAVYGVVHVLTIDNADTLKPQLVERMEAFKLALAALKGVRPTDVALQPLHRVLVRQYDVIHSWVERFSKAVEQRDHDALLEAVAEGRYLLRDVRDTLAGIQDNGAALHSSAS